MQKQKTNHSLSRRAYRATRSFLRYWNGPKEKKEAAVRTNNLKVAFIHNEKK